MSPFWTTLGKLSVLDQSPHRFGPFLFIRTLGRGGMGEVFVARTPWSQTPVAAVKRLRPDVAQVPTFEERFQHESELAVRLKHPHVVTTMDVGAVDDQLYVASELILGKDTGLVADRLRERGQGGPAAVAIRLFIDVLNGLSYVHGVAEPDGRPLRLVHRDVTPGNLLIGYDGIARLADFGLAKSLLTERSNLTQHGEILGTPHYLAPEVIAGEKATSIGDLYGVGAVMYRFLTGVAPHHGSTAEVLLKVLQEEPRPLSDLRPDLPAWLVEFVHRLLEKDPSRRPNDAAALGEQLIYDARNSNLLVGRSQIGSWLISLFEAEHAEETEEYQRIVAMELEPEPEVEGTVVLARPVAESRLAMPTPEAFREYEPARGTALEVMDARVQGVGGAPMIEEDADMPTRAASIFPGALSFDDGTYRIPDVRPGDEDTVEPTPYDSDGGNDATQLKSRMAPSREPSTGEQDSALPGFVGEVGRNTRPTRDDSVVVRPVASSSPELRITNSDSNARAPAEWPRSRPGGRGRPPAEPAPKPRSQPAPSPHPRSGGPRQADRVRITSRAGAGSEARSKNLALAGGLLVLAVVLGVGIGAAVATFKGRPAPVAPAVTERQRLAERFLALKAVMEGRRTAGLAVPSRVQRLATDAASALLQQDEEAAVLYLNEMERLLRK